MGMSRSDFLVMLRRRLGNPSVRELADDVLGDAVDLALNDYSQCKPKRGAVLITLQPYQEQYTLSPAPRYIVDVVPSAPTTASARAFGNEFRALELDLVSFAITDLMAHFEKISQYREMFEQVEWNYNEPPTLYISPSPVQQLQCIVITGDIHTTDSVSDSETNTMMMGAASYAQEMWANQRDSLSVMQAPSSAGTVELVNGDKLRELSRINLEKFRNKIGWNRPYIGQG